MRRRDFLALSTAAFLPRPPFRAEPRLVERWSWAMGQAVHLRAVPCRRGAWTRGRPGGAGRRRHGGSRGWWVSHEEQRPDRVVVFADDLPPGTHHHTVDLRSTSRGVFSCPPALVEAMYMPEVYGRSAGARLTVR